MTEGHADVGVTREQLMDAVRTHEARDDEHFAQLNRKLDCILLAIQGDGSDSRPGLRILVDRLTQAHRNNRALHLAWFSALIAAVAKWMTGV